MNSSVLKMSNVYYFFAAALLAVSVWNGVKEYGTMTSMQGALADNESRRSQIESEVTKIKTLHTQFAEAQAPFQTEYAKQIQTVLPLDENYTELTRQLDDFFASADRPSSKAFQSSLRFGKGEPDKNSPNISALSVSMNIEASRENFFKLLDFIHQSGSLESGTRLMGINSIQLNFPSEGEVLDDPKQEMNFTLDLKAYYQTPKISK